jgi:hypothetical protein
MITKNKTTGSGEDAGSSLADFSTLKMEAIRSSEMSAQSTTSTRRHTPEDGILHSHRRENLKSYVYIVVYLTKTFNCSDYKLQRQVTGRLVNNKSDRTRQD